MKGHLKANIICSAHECDSGRKTINSIFSNFMKEFSMKQYQFLAITIFIASFGLHAMDNQEPKPSAPIAIPTNNETNSAQTSTKIGSWPATIGSPKFGSASAAFFIKEATEKKDDHLEEYLGNVHASPKDTDCHDYYTRKAKGAKAYHDSKQGKK